MAHDHTTHLEHLVDLLRKGDPSAREQLIESACERLRVLTRKMLRHRAVHRWEETDDVLQRALIRLHQNLDQVQPESARDFLRIAAGNIRHVLVDLARHYFGPHGLARHEQLATVFDTRTNGKACPTPSCGDTPSRLVAREETWLRVHDAVDQLPELERETLELLWFHGLAQIEAAKLLGVSQKTVGRRWQRARLRLFDALQGELPIL